MFRTAGVLSLTQIYMRQVFSTHKLNGKVIFLIKKLIGINTFSKYCSFSTIVYLGNSRLCFPEY